MNESLFSINSEILNLIFRWKKMKRLSLKQIYQSISLVHEFQNRRLLILYLIYIYKIYIQNIFYLYIKLFNCDIYTFI